MDLPYSIRDGINAIRYTLKQQHERPDTASTPLFENALKQILGPDALDLEALAQKRAQSGERLPDMNLGDFFFGDNDELNPD
jgi:hypothetical protein